jgi:hypothetical protein
MIEKESRECQENVSKAVKKGILSIKPLPKKGLIDKVKEKCLLMPATPKLSFKFGINERRYRKSLSTLDVSEKELIARECYKHIKNLYCYNSNKRYYFTINSINYWELEIGIYEYTRFSEPNKNIIKKIKGELIKSIVNSYISQTYSRIKYDYTKIQSEWNLKCYSITEDEYNFIINELKEEGFQVKSSYDYIIDNIVYNYKIQIKLRETPKDDWINFQDQDKQNQICNSENQDQSDHHSSKILDSNHMKVE